MLLRIDRLHVEMPAATESDRTLPGGTGVARRALGEMSTLMSGPREGSDLVRLDGDRRAFTPEKHPGEIFEMAQKLYRRVL